MTITHQALAGKTVLIVEDDFLIASDLRHILASKGARILGPLYDVDKAIKVLKRSKFDCAVLDVFVRTGTSVRIAEILQAENVPFVVVSGYDSEAIPAAMRTAPFVAKPYFSDELVSAVQAAAARSGLAVGR